MRDVITVKGLKKSFKDVKVLSGIDFTVKQGMILALLGPNGAGKTTTVRILSTLLLPDEGTLTIDGHDVVNEPQEVRARIGLTGQFAAVDEYLTAEENLIMIGRLYHLSREQSEKRTAELLEQFDLVEASKRAVKTFSGGMRRRLDLAMSLIANPPVLFLDEPTTGLDPRSRLTIWALIEQLAQNGVTILLTTQYMDEADRLANEVVVIDDGRIIAQGTPTELKERIGPQRLEIAIGREDSLEEAAKAAGPTSKTDAKRHSISLTAEGGMTQLKEIVGRLEKANITVEDVSLHRPTLDDVFMTLTGHKAGKEEHHD